MKKFAVFALILLFPLVSFGQIVSSICILPEEIQESSGLLWLDHRLITHNDSGGEPILYEVDTMNCEILRRVFVENAENVDWEDLAKDETYLYIGDFGNNDGSRNDLKIYRVLIDDYLQQDTVSAEIISFNYGEQTDFTPASLATNFDAEAFVALESSLVIFTKNWLNFYTDSYRLPKVPGNYTVFREDTFNVQGLISGASFRSDGTLLLCGYSLIGGFTLNAYLNDQSIQHFDLGMANYQIDINSYQLEGVAFCNPEGIPSAYLSSEASFSGPATLYGFNPSVIGINDLNTPDVRIFPNPSSDNMCIQGVQLHQVTLYSIDGQKLTLGAAIENQNTWIDLSGLQSGVYFLELQMADGMMFQRIVKL